MSTYAQQLAALGLSDESVRQHVLANDIGIFRNRESAAYGREYERAEMLDGRTPSTDDYGD